MNLIVRPPIGRTCQLVIDQVAHLFHVEISLSAQVAFFFFFGIGAALCLEKNPIWSLIRLTASLLGARL